MATPDFESNRIFEAAGPPSQSVLRSIGWKAATLFERIGSPGAPAGTPHLFEAWAKAFAAGDEAALERRLGWDGFEKAAVESALGAEAPPEDWETPAWLNALSPLADEALACSLELERSGEIVGLEELVLSPPPPFLEIWMPFLRVARRALLARVPEEVRAIAPPARAAFEARLVRELAGSGELALYESFRGVTTGENRYARFIRSTLMGLGHMFQAYPVWARQLVGLMDAWVDATAELLLRLKADHTLLAGFFGVSDVGHLVEARPGLSDRHHGGRRVAVLGFSSGLQVVYKPRDVGLEAAFHSFVSWLRAHGLQSAPPPLRVLVREGYGWLQLAKEEPFHDRHDVERYYRRAGGLLAIASVLRGADLHNENIVASFEGPILVDAEALAQPVARGEGQGRRSCLKTGLLTLAQVDATGASYDVGGLKESPRRTAHVARRVWRLLRSDALHFVPARNVQPQLMNRVVLDGETQRPEAFREDVCAGFEEAYRFLLANQALVLAADGPVMAFSGLLVRVLFRQSDQYGALLYLLAAPRYQSLGVERSIALESLNRIFARETSRPLLWPLVADERFALDGLDIPRFALGTTDISCVSSTGEQTERLYILSGLDAVKEALRTMSAGDLAGELVEIRSTLTEAQGATGGGPGGAPRARGDGESLVLAAEALGTEVLSLGGGWGIGDRHDLYDGRVGIALFLSALAAITGEARWAREAQGALEPLARLLQHEGDLDCGLGGCSGLGSLVYTLVRLGHLSKDSSGIDLARLAARRITPERIESATAFDVADGAAGAILGLLTLLGETGGDLERDRAIACGRRLLALQAPAGGGGAWPTPDGRFLGGFAHGAAGAALALARLFEATGEHEFLAAARAALTFEHTLFSPADQNWLMPREDGGTLALCGWCHGAPGIALGRLFTWDVLHDQSLLDDVEVAAETTRRARRSAYDHVCCGQMARSEALLTVGLKRGNGTLVLAGREISLSIAGLVLEQGRRGVRTVDFEAGAFRPGFFQGLSGIGYQLLRTAEPERLSSVLAFEMLGGPA
jgi:lantibiotic modifying enzyme